MFLSTLYHEKRAPWKMGTGLTPDTKYAGVLILVFPASITARNKCVSYLVSSILL